MADIFLSYSHVNREVAMALLAALQQKGWSVYSDSEIPIGSDYYVVLQEELERARVVVVLWSKAAVASRWVRNEAEEGLKRGVLHPALIEQATIPLGFRDTQTANLIGWRPGIHNRELDKLVGALGNRLASVAPTPQATGPTTSPSGENASRKYALIFSAIAVLSLAVLGLLRGLVRDDPQVDTNIVRAPQGGDAASGSFADPGSRPSKEDPVPALTQFQIEPEVDLVGPDLDVMNVDRGPTACAHRCGLNPQCKAFVFAHTDLMPRSSGSCALKSEVTEKLAVPGRGYVAGWVRRGGP